jgi:murein DD-endopeptidase MepM/ murein hydrolase activator NlpD
MRKYLKIVFFLISISFFSQIKLKTFNKKTPKGFAFLANNDEFCPVSVLVELELDNMKSSEGNNKIFVVPARTKGYVITNLEYVKKGKYSFKTKTRFNYGNHLEAKQDTTFAYSLPFESNKKFKIVQGYNGSRTHQNENSLDFSMPINSSIYAVRSGVVIKVVEHNTKTCYKKECSKYNNEVLIYHKDGTFSSYVHINTNGVLVKVGDEIIEGQLIAKSGNIGWSSGPHLHFVVFNQRIEKRETLKTKFKVNDGNEKMYLIEKKTYARNY